MSVGKLMAGLGALLLLGVPARADVTVALIGPLTGPYAAVGDQLRRGAEQAAADINAAGGILGQPLAVVYGDDVCDPKQAVSVARAIAGQGVSFVVGHFCSGSAIPASNVYAEENMILISPGATSPTLTGRGLPNVFRTCGNDDQQGEVAGAYIAKTFPGKRVAIVHDKQVATKGQAEATRAALKRRGVGDVLYDAVSAGEKDYRALVTKLQAAQADVLFYGGYHTEAGLIIRQMGEAGGKTVLMGGDALMTPELWAIAGPAAEGTLMVFSPDPRRNPGAADVVARFRRAGVEPEGYTLYTYAAFQVFAEAMAAARSAKPADVLRAMRSGEFGTVLGPLRFDARGDVIGESYTVYRWTNGTYRYADE